MIDRSKRIAILSLACCVLSACGANSTTSVPQRDSHYMDKSQLKTGRPATGARVFAVQTVSVQDGTRSTLFTAPQAVRKSANGIDVTTKAGDVVHFGSGATVSYGTGQSFVRAGEPVPLAVRGSAKQVGVVRADGTY